MHVFYAQRATHKHKYSHVYCTTAKNSDESSLRKPLDGGRGPTKRPDYNENQCRIMTQETVNGTSLIVCRTLKHAEQ